MNGREFVSPIIGMMGHSSFWQESKQGSTQKLKEAARSGKISQERTFLTLELSFGRPNSNTARFSRPLEEPPLSI